MVTTIDPVVAAEYVRWSLAGGLDISKRIADRRNLGSGGIWAVVEPGTPLSEVNDPRNGSMSVEASVGCLAKVLARLHYDPQVSVMIVEDELQTVADPIALPDARPPFERRLAAGSEVFHVAPLESVAQASDLLAFLRWSSTGYPMNAFVVDDPSIRRQILNTSALTPADVDRAVCAISTVIVGAYDADGFIVWNASKEML